MGYIFGKCTDISSVKQKKWMIITGHQPLLAALY